MTKKQLITKFSTAGVATLVVFFSMGTGVYAYESPEVVDGHALHPIKAQLEKWEEKFAGSPEKQALFHEKMAERRLEESERHELFKKKADKLLDKASEELHLSQEEFKTLMQDTETRAELLEDLGVSEERHAMMKERMENQRKRIHPEIPEELNEEVQAALEEIKGNDDLSNEEKRNLYEETMAEFGIELPSKPEHDARPKLDIPEELQDKVESIKEEIHEREDLTVEEKHELMKAEMEALGIELPEKPEHDAKFQNHQKRPRLDSQEEVRTTSHPRHVTPTTR